MINGFGLGLGLKIFVQDISLGSLDGILLCIFFSDEAVFEPFFCPISPNPLDLILAAGIGFLRVCFVQLVQIWRQILGSVPTVLSATLSCRLLSVHEA